MSSKHKYRVAVARALETLTCVPEELRRPHLGQIKVAPIQSSPERKFHFSHGLCEVEGVVVRTNRDGGFAVCVMMTLDRRRNPAWEYPHGWHHTWVS